MRMWLKRMLAMMMMPAMLAGSAWAEEDAGTYAIVYFQDGSRALIAAEIANDPAALSEYCAKYFPGREYTADASVDLSYDAILSAEAASAHFGADSTTVGVSLVTLGLSSSVVSVKGTEVTVPTAALTFDGSVDGKHLIGVVSAPRTGEATLREEASGNGAKVASCKAGRIVAVLEYSAGTYTKILYDGVEGYIRTDCLIFHDGSDTPAGEGMLHLKGAVDGAKSVSVYSTDSTSKAKTGSWKTGTTVTVYDRSGDWYTVEWDGWVGYVQEQYLMMTE